MTTINTPTGTNATATPAATEFALALIRAESALLVALSEIRKPGPDWDYAYDFADRAEGAVGLLRILAASAERSATSPANSHATTASPPGERA